MGMGLPELTHLFPPGCCLDFRPNSPAHPYALACLLLAATVKVDSGQFRSSLYPSIVVLCMRLALFKEVCPDVGACFGTFHLRKLHQSTQNPHSHCDTTGLFGGYSCSLLYSAIIELVQHHIFRGQYPQQETDMFRQFSHRGRARLASSVVVFAFEVSLLIFSTFGTGDTCLQLVKSARGLRALFNTLLTSLPAVLNVSCLMLLILFVFSVLAMNLFGDLEPGTLSTSLINERYNYRTFYDSLCTLMTVFTGTTVSAQVGTCV